MLDAVSSQLGCAMLDAVSSQLGCAMLGAVSMYGVLAGVQSACVCYAGCSQLGCAMLGAVSSQLLGVLWWVQSAFMGC